ncbi:hypothetical protein Scep_023004 [Stephania cephalantha]|uniref:Plastid movement impaired 2 n=1 Tax=Stephania cephalantha TaxID=152367 RepID=A0AAP0F8Y9_9MAGN
MGNTLRSDRKTTKVMKIDGATMKLKTPIKAGEVLKDYPDHVLIESESVKHYGTRAKPMEPQQELKARRLYFLVVLPKIEEADKKMTRRVKSGINMSAKERLESLMLSRRSTSDLSILKPKSLVIDEENEERSGGGLRVKMRLPKAEVEKLMEECSSAEEAAEKILELYSERSGGNGGIDGSLGVNSRENNGQWRPGLVSINESFRAGQEVFCA